jgi:hypothetical protein
VRDLGHASRIEESLENFFLASSESERIKISTPFLSLTELNQVIGSSPVNFIHHSVTHKISVIERNSLIAGNSNILELTDVNTVVVDFGAMDAAGVSLISHEFIWMQRSLPTLVQLLTEVKL